MWRESASEAKPTTAGAFDSVPVILRCQMLKLHDVPETRVGVVAIADDVGSFLWLVVFALAVACVLNGAASLTGLAQRRSRAAACCGRRKEEAARRRRQQTTTTDSDPEARARARGPNLGNSNAQKKVATATPPPPTTLAQA